MRLFAPAGLIGLLLISLAVRELQAAPPPEVRESVVSLLLVWPSATAGSDRSAPEASAVAIAPGGYLATALHAVGQAEEIRVRTADGRIFPAELVGSDPATDLALLKTNLDLPLRALAPEPSPGTPVCAQGNAYGLDLSLTCGVVSAVRRSNAGFNPIEDFIQTDAVVNPGMSGGALWDEEGRLVGLLSAIFTAESEGGNIGINFAVSAALLERVMEDLLAKGHVSRASSGLVVGRLAGPELASAPAVKVLRVRAGSPAEAAAIEPGDLLTMADDRLLRLPSDLSAAVALKRPGESLWLELLDQGGPRRIELKL